MANEQQNIIAGPLARELPMMSRVNTINGDSYQATLFLLVDKIWFQIFLMFKDTTGIIWLKQDCTGLVYKFLLMLLTIARFFQKPIISGNALCRLSKMA